MHQVLFRIPLRIPGWMPDGIPIYGYGSMLFLACLLCVWLGGRRAMKEGVRKELISDLALWLFVGGIIGARLTFFLTEKDAPPFTLANFIRIWDGGLVYYGSVIGGFLGYAVAYPFLIRKYGISTWTMADIIAPSMALGLCLGRIGCLMNGCCYGQVACPDCPQISFPLSSPARADMVARGYQTAAGFTIKDPPSTIVGQVDPGSPAAASGLRAGDHIVAADDRQIESYYDLDRYLEKEWPRGKNDLELTVRRGGEELRIGPFRPLTVGLMPTQLFESIAMALLLLVLLAYYPFRRHPGELMALWMLGYGVERFFNERLRSDPRPITFERDISLLFIAVGFVLWAGLRLLPLPPKHLGASPKATS
jgi:prolipoprotein diacylglyceryltransferase